MESTLNSMAMIGRARSVPLESHRGGARDDSQLVDLSELRQEQIAETVADVFERRVTGEVGEGENGE